MDNNTPKPTPATPPFTVQHITPETITEQQRDIFAPIWNAELEEIALGIRGRLNQTVLNANREILEGARQMAKAFAAQLSRWNDNPRTSERLRDLQGSFEDLADDLTAAFNGELPGQAEGEEWKH